MSNEIKSYFQQLNNDMAAEIDSLVNNARKEARDDLDQFEKEIELIEKGYSVDEVLNMKNI